tara:strand:+ start:466 stop:1521 length:1056 start_codon:yes stop_codon:yes gene_type:complete
MIGENIKMRQTYCYDDVLVEPKYSELTSRTQVNLSSPLFNSGTGYDNLTLPVISSPMDTVTEDEMAFMMSSSGGLGVIHRYNTIKEQAILVKKVKIKGVENLGAAVGVTGDYIDRAHTLCDAGVNLVCVDIAHGYHVLMKNALKSLRSVLGDKIHIMAGNVATLDAFEALADWGADSIRVGVGGGSLCSTRIVSGHGIPSLQSVLDISRTTYETKIIADGGIRNTGDMVKALAAGADFIMVGSMLSGTDQTPGQIFTNMKGESYKVFRGMASFDAQKDWRGKSSTPEGISTTVPYRGNVEEILKDVRGGLSSGLSYSGARNLSELRSKATFVLQSNAAQLESSTHILWRDK